MSFVYDAGVLIAAEHNRRDVWAEHRARLEAGIAPLTTAPVLAQVSRSSRQVQLRRFLRGCEIAPFQTTQGHAVGALLASAQRDDVLDAHVVLIAAESAATILTADPADLSALSAQLQEPVPVIQI